VICHRRRAVIALPALVFLAFLASGVAVNLAPLSAEFGGRLRLPPVRALATAFYVLSATLNVLVTSVIVCSLVHRGGSLGAVQVLAESAALYAACSIVFVVLFQTRSPAQSWFGALANCSAVRAPPPAFLRPR
jgi:hypothetical protein